MLIISDNVPGMSIIYRNIRRQMITIRRIRYKDWFIQSCKCRHGDEYNSWSSRQPSNDAITAKGDVYFVFAYTEIEAIERLKLELDLIGDA